LMSLLSFLPSAASGAKVGFVFNNSSAVSGWQFGNVDKARFTGGGLLLEGDDYVKIGPPRGFKAPLRRVAVELRFNTLQSLILNIRVKSANGREAAKTLRLNAQKGGDEERVLRLYLGKAGSGGGGGRAENHIDNFIIAFSGAKAIKVRLDSLSFYEPTTFGRAILYWEEFWRPDFIIGTTVGYVSTPEAGGVGFISILYLFIGLTFISTLLFSLARGRGLSPRKAAKNLVIIVLLAGFLFAVRMDYNWLTIWRDDIKTLSGVDVDKRIRLVNYNAYDDILDFVDFVKRTVPSGSAVRPATIGENTSFAAIVRYYMLPLEDSMDAKFLWSYGDALRLDTPSGALYDEDGRLIVPRARLFARYKKNAAIYEEIR